MTDDVLAQFIADKSLVKIRRENLNQPSQQAFLVAFSDSLLLTRYVYDFRLDGYLLLRRGDITSITCGATDRFQRRLLADAGLTPADDGPAYPVDSFTAALGSLPANQIAILEREVPDDDLFAIGRYAGQDADGSLLLHEFSGAANWDDRLASFDPTDITCCQFETNYIAFYQQHFDRVGFPALPGS